MNQVISKEKVIENLTPNDQFKNVILEAIKRKIGFMQQGNLKQQNKEENESESCK